MFGAGTACLLDEKRVYDSSIKHSQSLTGGPLQRQLANGRHFVKRYIGGNIIFRQCRFLPVCRNVLIPIFNQPGRPKSQLSSTTLSWNVNPNDSGRNVALSFHETLQYSQARVCSDFQLSNRSAPSARPLRLTT